MLGIKAEWKAGKCLAQNHNDDNTDYDDDDNNNNRDDDPFASASSSRVRVKSTPYVLDIIRYNISIYLLLYTTPPPPLRFTPLGRGHSR